jgi:cytochrome oxidase Cu insertion factor (SCO1/SenC/PrrC family)
MGEIVQPIFITVDPKRDTGAVLAEYRKRYHSRLLALTGPLERLTAVAKLFRIYISSIPDGVDDYLVDHSICLYLMDTNGKILEYFGQVLRVFLTQGMCREMVVSYFSNPRRFTRFLNFST